MCWSLLPTGTRHGWSTREWAHTESTLTKPGSISPSAAPVDGRRSGERAARVVCGQRGRNMTVIMAISDQVGVAYFEVVWGGLTAEVFRDFLTSLGVILGDEPATVVMDNAPAHRGAELAHSDLHPVRKLAPHSPFLNPRICSQFLKLT